MILNLTQTTGNDVYIVADHIASLRLIPPTGYSGPAYTELVMTNSHFFKVRETPEEIFDQLRKLNQGDA